LTIWDDPGSEDLLSKQFPGFTEENDWAANDKVADGKLKPL
jgi:hypothetical protein